MILLNKEKITVANVDVYPDHQDKNQFWYIPGIVKLAERSRKKVLSYIWYIDGSDDRDGRGFLNFEVNTAVDSQTLDQIKTELKRVHPELDRNLIKLSSVTYNKGSVNFSVLGPVAESAPVNINDSTIIRQDKAQIVWNAGSSSLVGDNTAVCSVQFTKEGKLAAAIKAAIAQKSNFIAATYYLEFTGLRPAVTFTVKGDFTAFIQSVEASFNVPIPLEALILDIGFESKFEGVWKNSNMSIELINYTGEESEGLRWAQKIVFEYMLKNFFEVQIGDRGPGSPLSEKPEITDLIANADQLRKQGKEGKDVATALPVPIPQVKIKFRSYTGWEEHLLNFRYSEMRATTYPVAPQAVILLELGNPTDYILQVNRGEDMFGLPYPVLVIGPSNSVFESYGLLAVNVQATYPAGAPNNQQRHSVNFSPKGQEGQSSLPFQYNASGSDKVQYSAEYIFDSSVDWETREHRYEQTAETSKGIISAQPHDFLEFLDIRVLLDRNFKWYGIDEVVVSITSNSWDGAKNVIFQEGQNDGIENLKVRVKKQANGTQCQYRVSLKNNGATVHEYGPLDMTNNTITVRDQFQDHVQIVFRNSLDSSIDQAYVRVQYQDPDNDEYTYESEELTFLSDTRGKSQSVVIPTNKKYPKVSDFIFKYTVDTPEDSFSKDEKGGKNIFITGKPPKN
jgi:hypothetical protein